MTREFRQYVANMNIEVRNISIETHHSIDMIKRYHESLRRVYSIVITKILDTQSNLTLQMTFKAINDSVDSNKLVLILLVFETYSRMIELDVFSTITQRIVAMRKIMKEVRKNIVTRQINDAINTRNDSSIESIHDLSLNSDVFVMNHPYSSHTNLTLASSLVLSLLTVLLTIDYRAEPDY